MSVPAVRIPLTPLRLTALSAAYLLAHLFLDWISFFNEVAPLNITPWNPPSGLVMAVVLVAGARVLPAVWLALVLADVLVRGMPVGPGAILLSNAVIAAVYGGAALFLRIRFQIGPGLARRGDVARLLGVGAGAAAVVGALYIGLFTALGLFPWGQFPTMLLRHWTGEVIGIAVITPFLLVWGKRLPALLLSRHWRWPPPGRIAEAAAQAAAVGLALWADFGPLSSDRYEYFYILFLPLVWIASRHGLPGAVLGVLATQTGLLVAMQGVGVDADRMMHFQMLMLALTVTAQLLGAVVSDRWRSEAWVQERQTDFAHASRLTEAGEMTAALAHELNQPLTATMSYTRAARKIARRDGVSDQLAETLDKAVAQAERADRVMRSLRDFVRKGESRRDRLEVADLIADSLDLAGPVLRQKEVSAAADVPAGLPAVRGDAIQLQQVLLNLLRNAAEAVSSVPGGVVSGGVKGPQIMVSARIDADCVAVTVRDRGPGLSEIVERHLFSPFITTKDTGMGLGLSIARSILDAHGGTLSAQRLPEGGTAFRFTVPLAAAEQDREGDGE
ncbi:ATP-binding protein [Novispirillum itersonii]|uniref:histidine kinase n=1 Tax=Novispirillum itersonii TaxID=189 RepID=A0A7W9ZCE7_NOVIT|nr:ATP-binding protein [Novispirillum itersonii]MBB6208851.1 signal transduction histidine kinase [Novispirillum itersonii]